MAVNHGTRTGYSYWCCRCDECKQANRIYQRDVVDALRNSEIPDGHHGRMSTYRNWGCRCSACTEANRLACAKWRQRAATR